MKFMNVRKDVGNRTGDRIGLHSVAARLFLMVMACEHAIDGVTILMELRRVECY